MAFVTSALIHVKTEPSHAPLATCSLRVHKCPRLRLSIPKFSKELSRGSMYQTPKNPAPCCVATLPKILISGAPASGKGTQCEYIVKQYGVVHISTGDMLRKAVADRTELGKEAQQYMDAGKLVPDSLVISLLTERISQRDCAEKGWLLDGFPRTEEQANALDQAGVHPSAVIFLEVPESILIERVIGRRIDPVTGTIYHMKFNPPSDPEVSVRLMQRSDDTEEKARVRLEAYRKHSGAIQKHYASRLKSIDGNRSKQEVFSDIQEIVDSSLELDQNRPRNGDGANGASESMLISKTGSSEASSQSNLGISVPEFVRRAEEAYDAGILKPSDVNWSGQAAMDFGNSDGVSSYIDILSRLDVAFGDVLAFLLFAYIGRAFHGSPVPDFNVLKTAFPFLVSWFCVAPLLGVYRRKATANFSLAIQSLVPAWLVSVPLALGVRGIALSRTPPASFAIISMLSTLIILSLWRIGYVKVKGTEDAEFRRGGPLEGIQMITTLLRRW